MSSITSLLSYAVGIQDKYAKEHAKEIATSKFDIINPDDYFVLNTKLTNNFGELGITTEANYFNNVTIVLPSNITTTDIASIAVFGQGSELDRLYGDVHISTLCALLGKKYKVGGRAVPLVCAPFYENNLVPAVCCHSNMVFGNTIRLKVELKNHKILTEYDIYADAYFPKTNVISKHLKCDDPSKILNLMTYQSQITIQTLTNGENKIRLNFNHPGYGIFFYGVDKSKIKSVKLVLNGCEYFSGPICLLESNANINIPENVTMLVTNTSGLFRLDGSQINFSRIDTMTLTIDYDYIFDPEKNDTIDQITVVCFNSNYIRFQGTALGMAYSN